MQVYILSVITFTLLFLHHFISLTRIYYRQINDEINLRKCYFSSTHCRIIHFSFKFIIIF
jgi:hypothetical protein